jgi:hypothetical protein
VSVAASRPPFEAGLAHGIEEGFSCSDDVIAVANRFSALP